MKLEIILFTVWIVGFLISYWMMKVEIDSEGRPFTFGHSLFRLIYALASWITITIMLVTAWYRLIGISGYWNKPVKRSKDA